MDLAIVCSGFPGSSDYIGTVVPVVEIASTIGVIESSIFPEDLSFMKDY